MRFSNEEFSQFLKTALGNELAKAAVLIVDLEEEQTSIIETARKPQKSLNAFSNDAFIKESSATKTEKEKISGEIKRELQKTSPEFTDKKTGHIYIKESSSASLPEDNGLPQLKLILENSLGLLKNSSIVLARAFRDGIKNLHLKRITKLNFKRPEISSIQDNLQKSSGEKAEALLLIARKISSKIASQAKIAFSQKNKGAVLKVSRNIYRKSISGLGLLTPSLEKIKMNIGKMDYQQRLYAALILILILVVPLIGIKIKNSFNQDKPAQVLTETPP
ncbi:MAG: hypothetical protein U0944_00710, partial [Candidatus Moranbacteria bacterium]|nr:hypothetical protein [Candidatus Moranbacteria bacterium]